MRTIYPFCVPCEHPFVGQCPPDVQEQFRKDLRRYEKQHKVTLDKDPETGDYMAMSGRLEELEDELYNRNPYSKTMLLWFVLPGMNPSPGSRVEAMIQGYARLKAQANTRKEVQLINRFLRDLGTLKLCLKDQR